MNMTVFTTFYLPQEIGRVVVYQQNGTEKTELGIETCSGERRDQMIDFWSSRELEGITTMPDFYLQCVKDEAILASEERFETNFAGVQVMLESCPEYRAQELCASKVEA